MNTLKTWSAPTPEAPNLQRWLLAGAAVLAALLMLLFVQTLYRSIERGELLRQSQRLGALAPARGSAPAMADASSASRAATPMLVAELRP